nr:glycosyltransferase [Terrabacter sp. Ter38]
MGVRPLRAPFPYTPFGRRLARASSRVGHPLIYDALLRRGGASLVHAHYGTGAAEALPIAKRAGLPLVVTFHGHDVNRAPSEDADGFYGRRLSEVFAYADLLLPVSRFLAGRLLELGAPPEKVRVHYLGAPVAAMLPDPSHQRSGVAYVGRLTAQKGVEDLIRAYAALPPDMRAAASLSIVGDGPERARLGALATDLLPDGDVRFLGPRSSAEVTHLLSSTRLFVAPSKRSSDGAAEAFGLTIIEASMAGAPVIGYDYAGVPEAVADGESGLLVPEGDIAALTAAMVRVLGDHALAQSLGRAGQQRAVQSFDGQRQMERLEALYDDVVGLGPSNSPTTTTIAPASGSLA